MAFVTYETSGLPSSVLAPLAAAIRECETLGQRVRLTPDSGSIQIDWTGYVHHSAEMAALMLEASIDHAMTSKIWESTRWVQVCDCMRRMDGYEKAVISALVGSNDPCTGATQFNTTLRRLISLPSIAPFFAVADHDDGTHYSVSPTSLLEGAKVRTMSPGMKALLALLTTAYNANHAAALFRGRGLALMAGATSAELLALPREIRNDALRLIAAYSGW